MTCDRFAPALRGSFLIAITLVAAGCATTREEAPVQAPAVPAPVVTPIHQHRDLKSWELPDGRVMHQVAGFLADTSSSDRLSTTNAALELM
jgi:hypothetical protein